MPDPWTYDTLRRRWVATVPNPSTPAPTEAPPGTAYGDWPRCPWPSGCTIGVRDATLCSPHSELVLAYGHDMKPAGPPGATAAWQRCAVCGTRGGMHSRLTDLEEAAALVWLEDHDRAELTPPPPPSEQVRRVLAPGEVDTINLHRPSPPRRYADEVEAPGVKVARDARPTAVAAAGRAAPGSGTQRGRVLRAIVDAGDEGATDEQVMERLGLALNSVRPRRLELCERDLVMDSGDTRPTAQGNAAVVWLATLAGAQAVPS